MFVHTQVYFVDVFLVFFFTLGPLKALDTFSLVTRKLDPASRRGVACRAATVAGVVVLTVALLGSLILQNWRISVAAVVISGSIIIFFQSLPLIMEPLTPAAPPIQLQDAEPVLLSAALPYFPVAVPALVTAPGLAAILVFMAIARGDWTQMGIVLGIVLFITALNLITLLHAETLSRTPAAFLKVVRWVMAALQAVEAVQYLFNGLIRAGVV